MKYRESVSAIIFDQDKNFLLVQPKSYKNDQWNFVGGGVQDGETHVDAVQREIKEEVAIDACVLKLIGMSSYDMEYLFDSEKQKKTGFVGQHRKVFLYSVDGKPTIVCQPEEIRQYRWVHLEELHNFLVFSGQYDFMVRVLTEFGIA